jgi:hypothetical protein
MVGLVETMRLTAHGQGEDEIRVVEGPADGR